MRSTHSTIKRLQQDFPEYQFEPADEFWWSAAKETIFYDPNADNSSAFSLHELSHAILEHRGYEKDIDLVKLERDAWEYAKKSLSERYNVIIDDDLVQSNLDTYRQWLHARSKCPDCETTGLQSRGNSYHCIACGKRWLVNEARLCALRRYSLQTK